jgi:hypothetical protein
MNGKIDLKGRSIAQYISEDDMYKCLVIELQQENEDLRKRLDCVGIENVKNQENISL